MVLLHYQQLTTYNAPLSLHLYNLSPAAGIGTPSSVFILGRFVYASSADPHVTPTTILPPPPSPGVIFFYLLNCSTNWHLTSFPSIALTNSIKTDVYYFYLIKSYKLVSDLFPPIAITNTIKLMCTLCNILFVFLTAVQISI